MPINNIKVTMQEIPYGNSGIMVSADNLVRIIKQCRTNPELRFLAEDIVQHCKNKDYKCEINSIYNWVRKNIRFTRDPYRVEMLRDPLVNIERGNGDCDDHTIILNSLLQSIGHPTRVVLVASRKKHPDIFNHVFTEVAVDTTEGRKWIPLDTTVSYAKVGWIPPGFRYKRLEVEE